MVSRGREGNLVEEEKRRFPSTAQIDFLREKSPIYFVFLSLTFSGEHILMQGSQEGGQFHRLGQVRIVLCQR
jgi:hypothetical protein